MRLKTIHALALCSAAVLASPGHAAPVSATASYQATVKAFFDAQWVAHPTFATGTGLHQWDNQLDDVSAAAVTREVARLKDTETKLKAIDGSKLQASNNNDYTYFDNPSFNKQLAAAAALSGTARATAYAKLDQELMVNYAPVVPYLIATNSYFTSARVKNWIYSTYLGLPYLNALSVG